jgi:hypothetical protein
MEYRNRQQWGASYDVSHRAYMTGLPVSVIYIHHTVTNPTNDPNRDMQGIEQIDIGRFGVPSYSWVFHPSGVALEGMSNHRGAHTVNNANQSQNNISFGLSFIGNFQNDQPTQEAINACGEVIRDVIKPTGWLRPNWEIKGHRDVFATACPGNNLYPRIGEIKAIADGGAAPGPTPPPAPAGVAPPFPYPGNDYLGTARPDPHCHSGYYASDQPNVATWQGQMAARGWAIGVDGQYGPQSEGVCRSFQAEKGLSADGLVGPHTWMTTWSAPVT